MFGFTDVKAKTIFGQGITQLKVSYENRDRNVPASWSPSPLKSIV